MASRRNRGIVEEPCTLVYTLLSTSPIPFNDVSLIVRSLHSYMVESITCDIPSRTVTVKLGYQASVENAKKKLGKLINHVSVIKLSNHIDVSEIPYLEELKRKYGLPIGAEEDIPKKRPTKRPRYKTSAEIAESDEGSEHE